MREHLIIVSLAFVVAARADCEEPLAYPPEEYYLVKAVCQRDGEGSSEGPLTRVTYKVSEILSGPASLKDKYFIAKFAKPEVIDSPCLHNGSVPKYGETTYHWIVVGAGSDGLPTTKGARIGEIQGGPVTPDHPLPRFLPAVEVRHVSLTGQVSYPKLKTRLWIEEVVPNARWFPMTGRDLTLDAQWEMQRSVKYLGGPLKTDVRSRRFIFPPSQADTEEWMTALKEFCNERDVDNREKLLRKYVESKNEPLKEWAEFVVKKYGWKPSAPIYDDKK